MLVFFPRHRQLPADFGFGQRDGGEGVGIDFAGVVFGQKGDAHMVRHHVGEQVPLSSAADDVGRETLVASGRLNGFVEGRSGEPDHDFGGAVYGHHRAEHGAFSGLADGLIGSFTKVLETSSEKPFAGFQTTFF